MRFCAIAILTLAFLFLACDGCGTKPFFADGSIPDSGGPAPDAAVGAFNFFELDPAPNNFSFLAMAIGPNDHVGVAYFMVGDGGVDSGILLPDGGIDTLQGQFEPNYYIQYVEWANGAVVSGPQQLPLWNSNCNPPNGCVQPAGSVQLLEGIAVTFQQSGAASGQPVVAYMGGPNKDQSVYWYQQNATMNLRAADGVTWTEISVDRTSVDVPPPDGNPVDSAPGGIINGLYPSLATDPDGGTIWLAYRDVHAGQFPKQDWLASDIKVAWGQPSAFLAAGEADNGSNACYCASNFPNGCYGVAWEGNYKHALGGHNDLVISAGDEPAVVGDQIPGTGGGVDVTGSNGISFFIRQGTTWYPDYATSAFAVCPQPGCQLIENVGNDGNTGPTMAWDDPTQGGLGFVVVTEDLAANQLNFLQSMDGMTWVTPQPVFGYGSGAWYPSLAIDPQFHIPSIAFFFCSQNGGAPIGSPSQCAPSSSPDFSPGIYIAESPGSEWDFELVDPAGFYMPKIGYLSSGKRVLVYDRGDGSLWLAEEM